jgi:hypothetical protein
MNLWTEVIQDGNRAPFTQEPSHEVCSNESCTASDQHVHAVFAAFLAVISIASPTPNTSTNLWVLNSFARRQHNVC